MVYECKVCKFETTILTHFNTHKATKKHIKRCEECEVEPEKEIQNWSKIGELEKRIMELEMQLKMKDEMIEFLKTHAQPIQAIQVVHKKKKSVESEDDEPKEEQKETKEEHKETKEEVNDALNLLKSKLKYMNESEQTDFLHKYRTKSPAVKSWIINEKTRLLCEDNSVIFPEIKPKKQEPINLYPLEKPVDQKYTELRLKTEFPEGCEWLCYQGIMYVMDKYKTVYDVNSTDEIGKYDGERITFI